MTDRRRPIPVAAIAGGVFCLVLIYLALQVRAGNDPAIGAGEPTAAAHPRPVIVRRVIIERVIEEDAPSTGRSSSGSVARANAPAAAAPRPTAAAAPAPAAPAPAPAPAAPAPVVSRGS
jgi:hypothetical protein